MEFIKIDSNLDCIEADKLLEQLINYESKLDKIINGNAIINDFHKRVLSHSNVFAYYAKENNVPIGYIFAYLKTPANEIINTNVVIVESLFVKEEFRCKGVGKTFISMLEEWAKSNFENYVVEITALSNNEKAIEFYNKMGYSEVKVILRK